MTLAKVIEIPERIDRCKHPNPRIFMYDERDFTTHSVCLECREEIIRKMTYEEIRKYTNKVDSKYADAIHSH